MTVPSLVNVVAISSVVLNGLFKGQKKATVSWRTPNRVNIK